MLPRGIYTLLRGLWSITPTLTSQTTPLARPWQVQTPSLLPAQAPELAPALALLQRPLLLLSVLLELVGLL